jgi:hypothetical protein
MGALTVKLGEIVHFDVTTHSPSGGFPKNADSVPRFCVFEEDTDAAVINASGMTLRSGRVGVYKGYFPASVGNGFESQKWYNVLVSGMVEAVSAQIIPLTFFVETNSFDDLASTTGIIRQNLDKTGYILGSGNLIYYADVRFDKDNSNTLDEYSATYFRNDQPVSSGDITSPTIQVIKRSDGTDLIASTSLNFVSINVGTLKYNESSNRTTAGETYIVKTSAVIDGQARVWQKLISRDA